MPNQAQHTESYRKFKGLMPSVANLQSPEPRVLRGRNFRWQVAGPYSGWGNSLTTPPIPGSRWLATFHHQNRIVACSEYGIWVQSDPAGSDSASPSPSPCAPWVNVITCPIPTIPDDANPLDYDYPWSSAYVGSAYYYSHPLLGIIEYETCNDSWRCLPLDCAPTPLTTFPDHAEVPRPNTLLTTSTLATTVSTPAPSYSIAGPIFGITQANNKLIVLARDTVSWSVADAGSELTCDIHAGSGFQSLSITRYGRPLGVFETANGFNVYTTNGMINFETVCQGSLCQFRVARVSDHLVPINPFAIINHDARIQYYLAQEGLFVTDGAYPKPWEPIVGRYLVEHELPRLALQNDMLPNMGLAATRADTQHGVAMFYSPETGEIFISVRDHRANDSGITATAPDDPWHDGTDPDATPIHPTMRTDPLPYNTYRRSLVFNEVYGEWSSFDQPHRYIGPANTHLDRQHHSTLGFIHADRALRHFDCSRFNADSSPTCTCIPLPLDSFVQLGPFEYPTAHNFQQRTEVQHIRIHTGPMMSNESQRLAQTVGHRPDQWRDTSQIWSWYETKIASTNDGYTAYNSQWDVPWLVESTFYSQIYTCSNSGLAHMLTISADKVGMFYELNRVDINTLVTSLI